ncbi:Na+/H+ antiporter subunit E [Vreelandella olivaria]|uniref:Na+/H+ antiporter subunit E n=1 Tax=Vreelandella olivaria TaxID=390919 RepID=UPI00201E98BB|nr:Na+/H+ antiporter subunit E [Halomonas olivaria]
MHLDTFRVSRWLKRWRPPPWPALLLRVAVYSGLWWVITEGSGSGWLGLVLALLIALCAPLNVATWPQQLRWRRLPLFIGFMLKNSLFGALIVAQLALSRRCSANTHTRTYRFRLLKGHPQQLLMANLVNLTPGTLTLRLGCDTLSIHILHYQPQIEAQLMMLESHIAALYGLDHEPWEYEY